jgi:hypothetical protein
MLVVCSKSFVRSLGKVLDFSLDIGLYNILDSSREFLYKLFLYGVYIELYSYRSLINDLLDPWGRI